MQKIIIKKVVLGISVLAMSMVLLAGCGAKAETVEPVESSIEAPAAIAIQETASQEPVADIAENNNIAESDSETAEVAESDAPLNIGVGIGIDGPVFDATLLDSETARYLVSQIRGETMLLPLSYDQDGVMKYYDMPREAPEVPEQVTSATAGDILLDGGDRLIVFYQDAEFDGSYTRVGTIADSEGFAQAVGDQDIQFFMHKQSAE